MNTPLAEWDLNALLQFFCDSIMCVYMPLSSPWTDEAVSILRLWLSMKWLQIRSALFDRGFSASQSRHATIPPPATPFNAIVCARRGGRGGHWRCGFALLWSSLRRTKGKLLELLVGALTASLPWSSSGNQQLSLCRFSKVKRLLSYFPARVALNGQ